MRKKMRLFEYRFLIDAVILIAAPSEKKADKKMKELKECPLSVREMCDPMEIYDAELVCEHKEYDSEEAIKIADEVVDE